MSKLNKKGTDPRLSNEHVAGGDGAPAAKQSYYLDLRRATLAALLWEDSFYVDGESGTSIINGLIPLCDPQQVLDLAVECREMQKLRHMPLHLVIRLVLAGHTEGVADAIGRICTRPDMMTDLVALYATGNKGSVKPLPKCIQKGIAKAFVKFDEYQLAKYNRNNEIKLRDLIRLCHVKPLNDDQSAMFDRLLKDTLATPDTWEVLHSAAKDLEEKKAVWVNLMTSRKLPALAFLRNLSNMRSSGVDVNLIRNYFKYFKTVKSAMLLPLNFYGVYKNAVSFKRDIEEMMFRIYRDIEKLPGKTIAIIDVSGSMIRAISSKSAFTRLEVAKVMAMFCMEQCESCDIIVTAGNDAMRRHKSVKLDYPSRGFDLMDQIEEARREVGGGGIFTRQCINWCDEQRYTGYDRVLVFSDSQDMDKAAGPAQPKKIAERGYIIDVSAHAKGVNYKGTFNTEISGWSEFFIPFIAASEGEGLNNQFEQ